MTGGAKLSVTATPRRGTCDDTSNRTSTVAAPTALRVHLLAESSSRAVRFDTRPHAQVP